MNDRMPATKAADQGDVVQGERLGRRCAASLGLDQRDDLAARAAARACRRTSPAAGRGTSRPTSRAPSGSTPAASASRSPARRTRRCVDAGKAGPAPPVRGDVGADVGGGRASIRPAPSAAASVEQDRRCRRALRPAAESTREAACSDALRVRVAGVLLDPARARQHDVGGLAQRRLDDALDDQRGSVPDSRAATIQRDVAERARPDRDRGRRARTRGRPRRRRAARERPARVAAAGAVRPSRRAPATFGAFTVGTGELGAGRLRLLAATSR